MFRRLVAAPFTLVAARRLRALLRVGRPRAFRSSRSAAGGARPSAAPRAPRSASPPCGRFPCRAVPRSRPLPRCSPSLGLGRGAAPLALRRPCPRPRLGRRGAGRRPPRYAGRRGLLARVSWPSPSALAPRVEVGEVLTAAAVFATHAAPGVLAPRSRDSLVGRRHCAGPPQGCRGLAGAGVVVLACPAGGGARSTPCSPRGGWFLRFSVGRRGAFAWGCVASVRCGIEPPRPDRPEGEM